MTDSDRTKALGAADFIRNAPKDKPFCTFLTLGAPHPAYAVTEDLYDLIDPDKLPARLPAPERSLPLLNALREGYRANGVSEDDWKEIKRIYYAMCAGIDQCFGIVIDALKQAGLYDDTLIFFMSDHGDFTGDYSLPEKTHGTLQDCLIRSPLLVKPQAGIAVKPGIRHHLCELVDMTATIYDLCEIEPGYDSFGKSLRTSLGGCDEENREAVFAEVGGRKGEHQFQNLDVKAFDPESFYGVQCRYARPASDAGSYAISCRTQRWKYIRRGYVDYHEFYDLESDPGELNNLHGNPDFAEAERRMETLLLNHFMTTGDVMPHRQDSRKI
jgi:arylsulfatase A-like enzyme